MSKRSPQAKSKKFFNIDKEAKKCYPRASISEDQSRRGVPQYITSKNPRSGISQRGMYSSIFIPMI